MCSPAGRTELWAPVMSTGSEASLLVCRLTPEVLKAAQEEGKPCTHFTDQERKVEAHHPQAQTHFTGVCSLNPCHAMPPRGHQGVPAPSSSSSPAPLSRSAGGKETDGRPAHQGPGLTARGLWGLSFCSALCTCSCCWFDNSAHHWGPRFTDQETEAQRASGS